MAKRKRLATPGPAHDGQHSKKPREKSPDPIETSSEGSLPRAVVKPKTVKTMPELPEDVLLKIFYYSDPTLREVLGLSKVCKSFSCAAQFPLVWERAFRECGWALPLDVRSRLVGSSAAPPGHWRRLYFVPDLTYKDTYGKALPQSGPIYVHWKTLLRAATIYHHQITRSPADVWSATVQAHPAAVRCLKFIGDRMITGSKDGSIQFWHLRNPDADGKNGEPKSLLIKKNIHTHGLRALDFDFRPMPSATAPAPLDDLDEIDAEHQPAKEEIDEGLLLTSGDDGFIRFWELKWPRHAGTPAIKLLRAERTIGIPSRAVLLTPKGAMVGSINTILVFDRRNLGAGGVHGSNHSLNGPVVAIAQKTADSDEFVAASTKSWSQCTTSADGAVKISTHARRKADFSCLDCDGDYVVTGQEDGTVWLTLSDKTTFSGKGHKGAVTAVSLDSSREMFVTGSADGEIRAWVMQNGGSWFKAPVLHRRPSSDQSAVRAVHASNGRIVVGYDDGKLRIMTYGTDLPYLPLLQQLKQDRCLWWTRPAPKA